MKHANEHNEGFRLYVLLALFDRRDGTPLADMVQAAREGFERSHPDMAEDDAWATFDRLWESYTSPQRLELVGLSGYRG